jgi:hypothetical protein
MNESSLIIGNLTTRVLRRTDRMAIWALTGAGPDPLPDAIALLFPTTLVQVSWAKNGIRAIPAVSSFDVFRLNRENYSFDPDMGRVGWAYIKYLPH